MRNILCALYWYCFFCPIVLGSVTYESNAIRKLGIIMSKKKEEGGGAK